MMGQKVVHHLPLILSVINNGAKSLLLYKLGLYLQFL